MRISLSLIGLFYIIIVGTLCYLFPIPEILKGFLALPSFLIIPNLVGKVTLKLIKKLMNLKFTLDKISNFIIFWCSGTIFISLSALFLNSFHIFNIYLFTIIILIIMFLDVLNTKKTLFISKKKLINIHILLKKPYLIVIFSGLIVAIFITYFSPFPHIFGIDVFQHNDVILDIVEDNYFRFSYTYLPTFHIILSPIIVIFNASFDSMSFFWTARFITYSLYSYGLYLFFYQVSKNEKLALIVAIMGPWFTILNPPLYDISLYFFTPKIVILLIFPFILFFIHKNIIDNEHFLKINERKIILVLLLIGIFSLLLFLISFFSITKLLDSTGFMLLSLIVLYILLIKKIPNCDESKNINFFLLILMVTFLFLHGAMGLLAIFIIWGYLLVSFSINNYPRISRFLVCVFISFVILFLILQKENIIQLPPDIVDIYHIKSTYKEQPIGKIQTDFYYQYSLFMKSFPPAILALFSIGFFFDIFRNKNICDNIPILFVTSLIMLIYFLPINHIYRILVFFIPFIYYFVAQALLIRQNLIINKTKPEYLKYIHTLYFVIPIIIIISVLPMPYINLINRVKSYYTPTYNYSYFTFYDSNEYYTAKWIKSITKESTLIISDPLTQSMYGGISHRRHINAIASNKFQQHDILADILLTHSAEYAHEKIDNILSNKTLICYRYEYAPQRCSYQPIANMSAIVIINPRTSIWVRNFMWGKQETIEVINFDKFYNETYFTLLYSDSDQIYIFGVNPKPGVPFKIQDS